MICHSFSLLTPVQDYSIVNENYYFGYKFNSNMITKGRLEAFSDGVIAIIITIMVLELKVPHSDSIEALTTLFPVFISYVLSFVYVGIYWNNHHHMLHAVKSVNGAILWANLHLFILAFFNPFRDRLDGRESFWKMAGYFLRYCTHHECDCLYHSGKDFNIASW